MEDRTLILNDQGGSVMNISHDIVGALRAEEHNHQALVMEPVTYDARGNGDGVICNTITGDHGNRVTDYTGLVVERATGVHGDIAGTLDASYYKGCGERNGIERDVVVEESVIPFDTTQLTSPMNYSHPKPGEPCHPLAAGAHPPAVAIGNGQLHNISMLEVANTLDTMHDAQAVLVPEVAHALKGKANCDFREDSETYVMQGGSMDETTAVDCRNGTESADVNGTLQAKSQGGYNMNSNNICRTRNVVRRLTPLECTRLQGLPDSWVMIGDWVDDTGKLHKDSDTNKYKALGNSMAKPFWLWLFRRISAQYERPATLGSLFDGVGVAPLCWEQVNGRGTALWASEIEPFCIAVTKKHFPEEE